MTTKLGIGKVPLPPLSDSARSRMSDTQRGTSPSTHDSHDGAWPPPDALDELRARLRVAEERQAATDERIAALENRRDPSQPPGSVEVKSPGGWSGKAPKGAAIFIVLIIALTILRDEIGKLIAIIPHGK